MRAGAVEWVERDLWCTDATAAVAAEISAVQNISHARAVGQIFVWAHVAGPAPFGGQGVCARDD